MPKVISIHEITLRSDAVGREAEFEKLIAEVAVPGWKEAVDVKARLLKGVRGDRMGSYAMLLEWPSAEAFEQLIPLGPGEFTEAGKEMMAKYAAQFEQYGSFVASARFTDYLETAG